MLVRRLKNETVSLHRDVERAVRVMDDGFSAGDYRAYLAALYGFFEPLEQQLSRRAEWPDGFSLSPRLKAPLLAADLEVLGVAAAALPRCAALPAVETLSQALGALYVTEGATLGGRLVRNRLADRLPELDGATAYLACYGPRTDAMWRSLGETLEAAPDPDQAVAAACETFRCLRGWLEPTRGAHVAA